MTIETIAIASLVCAGIPCALFLVNLAFYRRIGNVSLTPDFNQVVASQSGKENCLSGLVDNASKNNGLKPFVLTQLPSPHEERVGRGPGRGEISTKTCLLSPSLSSFLRQEEREKGHDAPAISVLIPARNEEGNIRATLESVLANRGVDFETVVLDDHSTDRTADIVREYAARDARVRLESSPPLPAGWCGKQHACHILAQHAKHPLLVFMDADVRLECDALVRMTDFMECAGRAQRRRRFRNQHGHESGVALRLPPQSKNIALASGVPRQELGTFSERLLIPLIHFVLLGYLPMFMMRWTNRAAFSAGCGQLFVARADAYHACGGHAAIRATLHDGVKLPRLFRGAGFQTDLFDATNVASCRMYCTNSEVWRGLGKNATEGLAAPGTIIPMSVLLFGGQVLPFVLLAWLPQLTALGTACVGCACVMAYAPRLLAAWRFRQPVGSALLHPLGVAALLVIQWSALLSHLAGRPSQWKGRSYSAATVGAPAKVT